MGAERITIFLTIAISFLHHPSFSEDLKIKPLSLFFQEDPQSLGIGSIEPLSRRSDINKPAQLLGHESSVTIGYERENILNEKKENRISKFQSFSKSVFALLNLDDFLTQSGFIAFSASDFNADYNISEFKENTSVKSNQDYKKSALAFGYSLAPEFWIGAGAEFKPDSTDAFYELRVYPTKGLGVGFRRFVRSVDMAISSQLGSNLATTSLFFTENVNELNLIAESSGLFYSDITFQDGDNSNNQSLILELFPDQPLSVGFHLSASSLEAINDILINGEPGGRFKADVRSNYSTATLKYQRSASSRFLLGVGKSELDIHAGGHLDTRSILSFWEGLIAGERIFEANFSITSTYYHIGMENRRNRFLTIRGGLKYIDSKPSGNLENWMPIPIIKIGRTDINNISQPYKRASFLALSLGFTVNFKKLNITYGISQLVPVYINREGEVSGVSEQVTDDIWEQIKKDSGGNLQRIEISWRF